MNKELEEYRQAIEFLAENAENFEYNNKGSDHAAIVLTNMLRNTANEFLIFSGEFNGQVTNNETFLEELEDYLQSGKIFKLILEYENENESQALQLVRRYSNQNENISITYATETLINELRQVFDNKILHFAISDEKSYRLEIDRNNFKAVCNFNDQEIGRALKNIFNRNF